MTDNILGGVAIFICFYQAYRLGNDEKAFVRFKNALKRVIKQNEELQAQITELQARIDAFQSSDGAQNPAAAEAAETTTENEPSAQDGTDATVPPSLQALKGEPLNHG